MAENGIADYSHSFWSQVQLLGKETWGHLGSDTHLGLIHVGQGLLDLRWTWLLKATSVPREGSCGEGNPADVHVIFIPFHRLFSFFMSLCFLLYVHVSATPFPGVLSLFHSFCSVLLPQNVYTVDTMFICFLACNFLCVFYISK